MGRLNTGSRCLLVTRVRGYKREPVPPGRMTPFIPRRPPQKLRLVSVSVSNQRPPDGQKDDLQVERQTPMAQIVEVVLHPAGDGRVASPSVHLRPAGDANLQI